MGVCRDGRRKGIFLLSVFSGDVIFIINTPGLKIQEISDFGKSGSLVLRFSRAGELGGVRGAMSV